MGFHHVRDDEGNLHYLDDEQYVQYLEEQRNSWPNRIKRFFYKVLGLIFAVLFFLFLVGLCHGEDKVKNSKYDEEEKVEANDKQIDAESKEEIKPFNVDELEEVQPKDIEMEAEENSINNEEVEEQLIEEEINNNINENSEENPQNSSLDFPQNETQTEE